MTQTRFKLLVFDWDGTLADSLGQIVFCMEQSIRALGMEYRTQTQIQEIIGLGLNEALTTLYPDINLEGIDKLTDKYREFYLSMPERRIALYPGAEATLNHLYDAGYLLAVATGKSRRGLNRAMQEAGIERLFHASCCADEAFSKPHPQMLENIMDELGMEPGATLMIGDTEYDLQMARNAGTGAVAVNYGAHEPDRLLEFEPLASINNLEELPEWLVKFD